MIVVIGSRHDRVAAALVGAWPGAALCSAEDLSRPGWIWRQGASPPQWVVGGEIVADEKVTGIFVRRSAFYPEEFASTHPEDRGYLAAEAHAFLVFVLSATRATVASPVVDGALGDEAVRPERWIPAALEAGLAVAPVRLTSRRARPRRLHPYAVEVVGHEAFGEAPERLKSACARMADRLGMKWATIVFDGRHRVLTATSTQPPTGAAVAALGRMLAAPVPA